MPSCTLVVESDGFVRLFATKEIWAKVVVVPHGETFDDERLPEDWCQIAQAFPKYKSRPNMTPDEMLLGILKEKVARRKRVDFLCERINRANDQGGRQHTVPDDAEKG
jgi:hypothetical protein